MVDVYKIGVALALTSNHERVLGELAAGLNVIDRRVANLIGKFGGLKTAVLGAVGAFAGEKMLSGLGSLIERTKDLSHELVQIQKLGQSIGDVAAANAAALGITQRVRGINQKDILDIYSNVFSLVGKEDALKLMEPLAKFNIVAGNTSGDFSNQNAKSRALVRAAEQMGRLTNPETKEVDLDRFNHFLDLATRINNLTHGAVGAETWLNIAKTAGPSIMGMGDRGLEEVAIASQYMGGPRAGTAMMSTMQQFAGGIMFKRSAQALEDIGILKKGEWSTSGGRVVLTPEARQRLAGEMSDPLKFITKELQPALTAHGYDTPDKQMQELFALFGRQTTVRLIADLFRNSAQVEREMGRMDVAPGLEGSYAMANKGDVEQNLKNLTEAWNNLLYAVGGPGSKNIIDALHVLTEGIQSIANVTNAHPEAVKNALAGVAALGVGLMVFGGVAVVGALATLGALPAAIMGLAAAIAALGALDFGGITSRLDAFEKSIQSFGQKLRDFFSGSTPLAPGLVPMNYTGGGGFMPISYGPSGSSGLHSGGGYSVNGGRGVGSIGAPGSPAVNPSSSVPLPRSAPGFASLSPNVPSGVGTPPSLSGPITGLTGGIPGDVLAGAVSVLQGGGNLQRYMSEAGYPKSGAWCGQFAASVVKHAGGRPPAGAALADNWMHWGVADSGPHVGDVAVRNYHVHGHGHVGFVAKVNPDGTFEMLGGNQGGHAFMHRLNSQFNFRRGDSAFIPGHAGGERHTHLSLSLDGRNIARSVWKHTVDAGNRPASGGRLSDISLTRPTAN